MRRRDFIGLGIGGVATVSLGAGFWADLFGTAQSRPPGRGVGYGPLGAPDGNGVRLPAGFSARLIARGGEPVGPAGYVWHAASDGMAAFPAAGGGFVLVSNSESRTGGGASALRFGPGGAVEDAYRILSGTRRNCSGGGTPWGTWLSCEEVEDGRVWECDPAGHRRAVAHPAMGVFKHEAAAVDPHGRRVYLTEDHAEGGLYRYTPARWPNLSAGLLEIACVRRGGRVEWATVPDPLARRKRTRRQVPGSTPFRRGEGIWLDGRTLFVATTGDHRVHAYDVGRKRIRVLYDGRASRRAPLLRVDQLTGSRGGEVFVCEDIASDQIDMGLIARDGSVSRFLSIGGPMHRDSELTGVTFDPTGARMFFSSQRAFATEEDQPGPGAIFEVTGPFKGALA